jgi:hypothetical protein
MTVAFAPYWLETNAYCLLGDLNWQSLLAWANEVIE